MGFAIAVPPVCMYMQLNTRTSSAMASTDLKPGMAVMLQLALWCGIAGRCLNAVVN